MRRHGVAHRRADDHERVDTELAAAGQGVDLSAQVVAIRTRREVDDHQRGDDADVAVEQRRGEHDLGRGIVHVVGRVDDAHEGGLERRAPARLVEPVATHLLLGLRLDRETLADRGVHLLDEREIGDELVGRRGISEAAVHEACGGPQRFANERVQRVVARHIGADERDELDAVNRGKTGDLVDARPSELLSDHRIWVSAHRRRVPVGRAGGPPRARRQREERSAADRDEEGDQ